MQWIWHYSWREVMTEKLEKCILRWHARGEIRPKGKALEGAFMMVRQGFGSQEWGCKNMKYKKMQLTLKHIKNTMD